MATYDEYMRAARKAHAAGDPKAAKRLVGLATQSQQVSPEVQAERERMIAIANDRMENGAGVESATPQEGLTLDPRTGTYKNREALTEGYEPSRAEAMMGGAMQGTGLNYGDEVIGAMGRVFEGPGYGDLRREQARGRLEEQQERFPVASTGSEIAGNVATAAATLPIASGRTLLQTVGRGAALGGAEGAAYGSGAGEGLEDRLATARDYGAVGTFLGAVSPVAVAAGARAGRGVVDAASGGIDRALNRGSQGRAQRAISDSLHKSGKTPQEVSDEIARAGADGQPEFRLMDALGQPGQRRASGVVRSGGDGADELARFLNQRQIDQSDRVGRFVDDAFEGSRGTARQTRAALTENRANVADQMYDAARRDAKPVDVRGALGVIDRRIGGVQGSGVAGDGIDGALAKFRSRLAAQPGPDGVSRELSDFNRVLGVKQDVQDAISAAVRAGRNNEARELGKLVTALDEALEGSSDGYRFANDNFREASRVIDAVDTGSDMARRGRAADNLDTFGAMTSDQQRAARIGYGDAVQESIERNKAQAPNSAREFASTKRQQEAAGIANNPDLLNRRVGRENTMYDTYQRALGGSKTADNLEDIRDLGPVANVARAVRDATNLQFGSAAGNLGAAVSPALTGMNEPTRQIIARALLSRNPDDILQAIGRQSRTSAARRRVAEALARNSARDPAYSEMIPR